MGVRGGHRTVLERGEEGAGAGPAEQGTGHGDQQDRQPGLEAQQSADLSGRGGDGAQQREVAVLVAEGEPERVERDEERDQHGDLPERSGDQSEPGPLDFAALRGGHAVFGAEQRSERGDGGDGEQQCGGQSGESGGPALQLADGEQETHRSAPPVPDPWSTEPPEPLELSEPPVRASASAT